MRLGRSVSFCVLTSPSLCRPQLVSAPRSVGLFPCPDKFLPLPSPGCECASVQSVSFRVLTSPSLYHLQNVSAPRSVGFFPCHHQSLPCSLQEVSVPHELAFFLCLTNSFSLCPSDSEYPLRASSVSVSSQVPSSVLVSL